MEKGIVSRKELKILGGKESEKTTYIVNVANRFCSDRKILIFSLEMSKQLLQANYNLEQSDNIMVIDMLTTVEQIKAYLKVEKPDYLLIDSLPLLKTAKEFESNREKIKYILDILYSCIDEYNVNILVSDYLSADDTPDKYSDEIYDKCHQVWCLIDHIITRIK